MKTSYWKLQKNSDNQEIMQEAAALIRAGEVVSFPTETVYGLGADGLNPEAVAKIFAAKGRPNDNPLILHIAKKEDIAQLTTGLNATAKKLMEHFWPGPLTLIVNKSAIVPDAVSAGLETVAVRFPSNKSAQDFIRACGCPIAAPSANISGRPSPTNAQDVLEDMQGKVAGMLDGGNCGIGLESTVVDTTSAVPTILRPGGITYEMLTEVMGAVEIDPALQGDKNFKPKAPGMKYRHYAPKGQLTLVEGDRDKVIARINELVKEKEEEGHKVGVIGTDETLDSYHADILRSIGSRQKPDTVAANLYRILREFDDLECDYMYSESFFEQGLGNAIMNRMLKAAGYHLITL